MNQLAKFFFKSALKNSRQPFQLTQKSIRNFSSMEQLKKLRDETGSPIAQVKKALDEFGGDFEKAKQFLIEKGLASAQKKLDKETREGVIGLYVSQNRDYAVIGEVNCETDFVARSDLFLEFVHSTLKTIVDQKKDVKLNEEQKEEILQFIQNNSLCKEIIDGTKDENIDKVRQLVISKLQENINIRRVNTLAIQNGVIGSYAHNTLAESIGARACLVSLEGANTTDASKLLADNIALQILGMKPDYISKENIPADVLKKEIDRIKAEFGDGLKGKPQAVVDRMIEGKLKKFYEDNVLYDQTLLTDQEKDAKTIGQLISEQSKEQKSQIKIKEYILWTCK